MVRIGAKQDYNLDSLNIKSSLDKLRKELTNTIDAIEAEIEKKKTSTNPVVKEEFILNLEYLKKMIKGFSRRINAKNYQWKGKLK
jgi:hypothetical protein